MQGTAESGSIQHFDKNRRRHYFVNKKLQGKVILYFLLLGLLIALFTDIFIWYYSDKEINKYLYRSHIGAVGPWDVMFPIILKTVVIFSVVLIAVTSLIITVLSRRVASGLSGFLGELQRLGKGDLAAPVEPCGFEGLNEKLEIVRISHREQLVVLQDIQKKMQSAVVNAGDPSYGGKPLRDLENLSAVFMEKLSEFGYNKIANKGEV